MNASKYMDKVVLIFVIITICIIFIVNFKHFFVNDTALEIERFTNQSGLQASADFGANLKENACRCKNGAIGDVAHYIDGGTCICNPSFISRDRPELSPGKLGQQFRQRNAFYDLNCHMRNEFDMYVDTTQPYKKDMGISSHPMKFQTYKKTAYIPCNSVLNDKTTYEEQYKRAIMSQTKGLQNKPYLFSRGTRKDQDYFSSWATN
jgi:hypothetical protein